MSIKPQIRKSELVSLINDKGYTRKDLAKHYGVSVMEVNKYLTALNIKIRAKKMTYEVIDDTVVTHTIPVAETAPIVIDNVSAEVSTEVENNA
jgi:phage portal protein BeeE